MNPDQGTVLRGLSREDLYLVVHERFMTDSARYADVVLPATTSLEHADLYKSYGQYAVQRVRPAIPPLSDARPNWEVFRALAAAMGYGEPIFQMTADEVIELLIGRMDEGWLGEGGRARLLAGEPVVLAPPPGPRWGTPSGKIELLNPRGREPLPRFLPTHAEDGLPLRLVTAPALNTLNSSFQERPELRARAGGMTLKLAPSEAAARGLRDGQLVVAFNELGEAAFRLRVAASVPSGVVVAEGVFWLAHAPGARNVNALTSQRLTDEAGGSTFYDNRVEVRAG